MNVFPGSVVCTCYSDKCVQILHKTEQHLEERVHALFFSQLFVLNSENRKAEL